MKKSLLMLLSLAVVGSTIVSACPCNKPRPRDGEIKTEREDKGHKPGCNCGK